MNSKKFHLLFDIRQNLVLAVTSTDPEAELTSGGITQWTLDNKEVLLQFAASSASGMETKGVRVEKRRVAVPGEHNVSALAGPFLMIENEEE